jgi:hypothetical protein
MELQFGGQFAVDEQKGNLEEAASLCKLLNRIASVL